MGNIYVIQKYLLNNVKQNDNMYVRTLSQISIYQAEFLLKLFLFQQ